MGVIRVCDQRPVCWKNGAGVTRELLVGGASGDAFDWRISVATIATNGPFSIFSGYDRTLIVLEGRGSLEIAGRLEALQVGEVIRFSGELPVFATVNDDPLTVLNIMCRTGHWRHELRECDLAALTPSENDVVQLFAILEPRSNPLDLQRGDLITDISDVPATMDIVGMAISIRRCQAKPGP